MADQTRPLIVGAGPTGTGAALFLARAGIDTRVIDAAPEPAVLSKALAVNPRTLEILEPTGVTERMLAVGLPVRGGRIHQGGKVVAEVLFDRLPVKYPFMLALSQATTERLLREALTAAGGAIERGVEFVGGHNNADGMEVELRNAATGKTETTQCPWILAADGAHSAVRHAFDVGFPGSTFDSPWYLADVPIETTLESDFAHIIFIEGGFLFMIRVVDEASGRSSGAPLWRVLGNLPEPLKRLVNASPAGPPVWESSFRIAHRINERLQIGNVYFAGDAAHLHSPVGARGMNLGLEDAYVFSKLAAADTLSRYERLRRPVDAEVVRRVERISRTVISESPLISVLRKAIYRWGSKMPLVRKQVAHVISGLDHPLVVS